MMQPIAAETSLAPTPYTAGEEHLADELAWLDLLLQLRVAERRLRAEALPATARQSLFIAHAEVEALLQPAGQDASVPALAEMRARLAERRAVIEARAAATLEHGADLSLARLGRIFGLTPFELDMLLICLAPELDRKYDRVYAYLQDDITRKKPSVDLALSLLYDRPAERWRAKSSFAAQAPLLRYDLLQASDDPQSPSGSSDLARFLKLDPRIAGFLLGDGRIDGRLAGLARLEWPDPAAPPPLVERGLLERALRLVEHHCAPGVIARRPLLLHLSGPYGSGGHELALAICAWLSCPLLVIDSELLLARGGDPELLLRLACREGPLCQAAIYIERAGGLLGEDERARAALRLLTNTLVEYGWLTFLAGEQPWPAQGTPEGVALQRINLLPAAVSLREEAWRYELARVAPGASPIWADELARRFRLSPSQIRAAATDAMRQRVMDGAAKLSLADLGAACRRQSSHTLAELAQKLEPRAGWADLVLPADRIEQLRELCGQVREHERVFGEWGFGRKISRGRGVSALFTGPPGTGKTMAAEVIAGELGLDLYRIDLSQVVSKYIGETEKNLARIFQEAEGGNAILFFDEADALFGKRTEVSDAHDRYANVETSYLLQRMEQHDGVVILASNLRENMDEAFVRRLRCIVEFPLPDEASRLCIWQSHLPAGAPREALDLAMLARRHDLAGGNIRNIVLRAAFLAANDGGVIGMAHVLRAARREYEQLGRLWGEG